MRPISTTASRSAARRPFVQVVAALSVGALTMGAPGTAAANPPAPSTVPDPVKLASKNAGELPQRIKRHDGGCYLYGANGPVEKTECPTVMDKSGEEIERETESGQCIHIEPWKDEPAEVDCPAVLVPVGFVAKKVAITPKTAAPAAASATPPSTSEPSGCARSCATTSAPASNGVVALGFGLAIAASRRGRRRTR